MQERDLLVAERATLITELGRKEVETSSKKVMLNGTFRQTRLDVLQALRT